jgi:hypothetical protein
LSRDGLKPWSSYLCPLHNKVYKHHTQSALGAELIKLESVSIKQRTMNYRYIKHRAT